MSNRRADRQLKVLAACHLASANIRRERDEAMVYRILAASLDCGALCDALGEREWCDDEAWMVYQRARSSLEAAHESLSIAHTILRDQGAARFSIPGQQLPMNGA